MLLEVFDPETVTAAELRERYEAGLTSVVESVGVVAAADVTGIESERLDALRRGKGATLTVREASALLALSDEWPDEETLLLEVRDSLLLGMSAAVLDVETLASELDGDLSARELQRKIEGRTEMTLGEYATVTHRLAEKNPY